MRYESVFAPLLEMLTRRAEALYPKAMWHWCWRNETRVERSRTSGHAFRTPELAGAEDPCARRARLWLSTGKSSVGSQHRVRASSHSLLSAVAVSSFFFCQPASSATVESQTNSFNRRTDVAIGTPSKIARPTGEMPRSAVFGSSVLITLTVLHALPVLARINAVGFAECSHEA